VRPCDYVVVTVAWQLLTGNTGRPSQIPSMAVMRPEVMASCSRE